MISPPFSKKRKPKNADDRYAGRDRRKGPRLPQLKGEWLEDLGELDKLSTRDTDHLEPIRLPEDTDLSFLDDLAPAPLAEEIEPAEEAELKPAYADVDDLLASFDAEGMEFPSTGELVADADLDVDQLFDEALADLDEEEEQKGPPIPLAPDAPEWLADLSREGGDEGSAAAMARQKAERPREELPDRLRMLRDRGLELRAPQEQARSAELETVLPGVKEVLPALVFKPTETKLAAAVALTEQQRQYADVLRTVIGSIAVTAEEAAAVTAPAARRARPRIPVERLVIALILTAAILLPFANILKVGDLPPAEFAAASRQQIFFDRMDALQPGQWVLVATEYGPTGAAGGQRDCGGHPPRADPAGVSGDRQRQPGGLLHVNAIMENMVEQNLETTLLARNQDFTVGSYLVGDVTSLRSFSENVDTLIQTDLWE
jgi:hypothetical protein